MLTSGQCIVLDLQNNSADDELRPQVLVADEDSNRALRATNVLALIAREAGDSLEIQFSMWRFDSFNSPTLRATRPPRATGGHYRCRTREQQQRRPASPVTAWLEQWTGRRQRFFALCK